MMKPDSPKYELPVPGSAWATKVELGAGIYFLEGRTYVAGHSSPAEQRLLERGAFLLASLRFERELLEGSHPDCTVQPLDTRQAVMHFGGISWRN